MLSILLEFHSYFRWVVLIAALAAIVLGAMSLAGSRPWDGLSDRVSLIFTIAMDIQLLVGIALWLFEERWKMGDLVTWGHPVAMLVAVGLVHMGRKRIDAASSDRERGSRALIFFGGSLLLVLASIPTYSWPL